MKYVLTVNGSEIPPSAGSMDRGFDETYEVEAEHAGEALVHLVNREIEWGILDDSEPITLTVRLAVSARETKGLGCALPRNEDHHA